MYLLSGYRIPLLAVVLLLAVLLAVTPALAHCDTLDGPVIADARQALALGDVTPVLKWTMPEHEQEVRAAFDHALAVRKLGPAAQELADTFFFETLVRVHRAGEGAPYTGLKPSADLTPAVAGADRALDEGTSETVEDLLIGLIRAEIEERFAAAFEARQHAGDSVAAGRQYVAAYVQFVHYIEGLEAMSMAAGEHGAEEAGHARESSPESAHGQ